MIDARYNSSEICTMCLGEHVGTIQKVNHILYDSRAQQNYTDSMFIALIGARHNGHHFIKEAYSKGIRSFLISDVKFIDEKMNDAAFIVVKDTLKSLHKIVQTHREKFKLPVIGITGSNGKTIIKEWLFQILKEYKNTCRSPKSYNSQIGVPFSVWNLNTGHELGIFEAGISQPHEMSALESIIQPSIGIFTNIGSAHAQNFESQRAIIAEKAHLFYNCQTLIYCKDHYTIHDYVHNNDALKKVKKTAWSKNETADLVVESIDKGDTVTVINGLYLKKRISISIPFKDDASIENAIHVWLACLVLEVPHSIISKGMLELNAIAMRLELIKGVNNCTLINDTYNSDITSLKIAITYLKQQQQHPKHTLILSDILQNSSRLDVLYDEVADLAERNQLNRIIAIGSDISSHIERFSIPVEAFSTTEAFLSSIHTQSFNNEAILIKGARQFQFERITDRLQEKAHNTTLEVNLNNLISNFNYYKSILNQHTKVMVMVKALSYGSGTHEIANILEYYKADYLAVAYTDEGIALRRQGIKLPIMVLNPEPSSFESLFRYNLEAEIFSLRLLRRFVNEYESFNRNNELKTSKIHLKIDTGMRRLGFEPDELEAVVEILKQHPQVEVASIFSHLAASDDDDKDAFTALQFNRFAAMDKYLKAHIEKPYMRHILNSSGILRFPGQQYEMVRLGIGLYGISNTEEHKKHLQPVHRLVAHISQIKQVKKGETIGYGRRGVMPEDGQTATVAIGYADGVSRKLGNGKWEVVINGQKAPTIGSICMDMLMVNITQIDAEEGDEVVIFGPENTLYEFSDAQETIPYEVLTAVGNRVKRAFYLE